MKYEFSNEERETFFERHFDYEAEDAENKTAAECIYEKSRERVASLTEQLIDGEVVDEQAFSLELKNLILSHEYRNKF